MIILHRTSGAINPCVPAKLVLVVSASGAERKPPSPGTTEDPSPGPVPTPPSSTPPASAAAFAPRVSLLTSKSASKKRPSACTSTLPGWRHAWNGERGCGRRKQNNKERRKKLREVVASKIKALCTTQDTAVFVSRTKERKREDLTLSSMDE